MCLIPNSTHILQPLDQSVFKPAKTAWAKIVEKNNKETDFRAISKDQFPKLLKMLLESKSALCRRHAVAGFEATGIYPLDRNVVDRSQFSTTVLRSSDDEDDNEDEDGDDDGDAGSGGVSLDEDDIDDTVSSKATKGPLQNLTNTQNHNLSTQISSAQPRTSKSPSNTYILSQIVSDHFNNASKQVSVKGVNRKLVSSNGACLTSNDALRQMRDEKINKRIKLEAAERKKIEREEAKAKVLLEKAKAQQAKNETALKKLKESEQHHQFLEMKKRNKSLKRCHLCEKSKEKDKKHGSEWIYCFRCNMWACYAWMPNKFHRACSELYKCDPCVALEIADSQPINFPDLNFSTQ